MVARLIHKNGPRKEAPFIAINCGAVPAELMESEFFGHKKGSFTGAQSDKEGLFKAADGGTLFLDEIADLPLNMQVKLLRAIQERCIRPVGAEKEESVNVRILSASHKDLAKLVQQGEFRQDLFYRINVIEVEVPPLRERKDDIPELVDYFIGRLAQRNQIEVPKLSRKALEKLQSYDFPGNIRELENILERAMTLTLGDTIEAEDIQLSYYNEPNNYDIGAIPARNNLPLEDFLEAIERKEILAALAETDGNKTAAAEKLGISFRAMRYKCKKLGID
jgi:two-component system response regulator PilR (NtrC family)